MSEEQTVEYRPHPEVLTQTLPDGEVVLLHMPSEVYYGLDPVGARVWQLLGEGAAVDAVVGELMAKFEVGEERLRSDVTSLVSSLLDAGLVEVSEHAGD